MLQYLCSRFFPGDGAGVGEGPRRPHPASAMTAISTAAASRSTGFSSVTGRCYRSAVDTIRPSGCSHDTETTIERYASVEPEGAWHGPDVAFGVTHWVCRVM